MAASDSPAARLSSTTETMTRVPLMHGLLWHTSGSTLIRSRHFIVPPPPTALGGLPAAAPRPRIYGPCHPIAAPIGLLLYRHSSALFLRAPSQNKRNLPCPILAWGEVE